MGRYPVAFGAEAGRVAVLEFQVRGGVALHTLTNDHLAEMWSGSEEGSYLRLIDCCITQV